MLLSKDRKTLSVSAGCGPGKPLAPSLGKPGSRGVSAGGEIPGWDRPSSFQNLILWKKELKKKKIYLFVYLANSGTEREREGREAGLSHLLMHSPGGLDGQAWVRCLGPPNGSPGKLAGSRIGSRAAGNSNAYSDIG